jgi:hypothetical protein
MTVRGLVKGAEKYKTASFLRRKRLYKTSQKRKLLVRFFPNGFADKSGQAATIGGFAFESIAGAAGSFESNAFQNFGFDG